MDKSQIAREAFYGMHESLMAYVMDSRGYIENGVHYPANCIDLSECIEFVENMPEVTIISLISE